MDGSRLFVTAGHAGARGRRPLPEMLAAEVGVHLAERVVNLVQTGFNRRMIPRLVVT